MNTHQKIIDCYNATAENYAKQFIDELSHKHLDRILLKQFADENKGGNCIDLGCGPGQTTKFLFDSGSPRYVKGNLPSLHPRTFANSCCSS